jgi:hypothetical protein
VGHDQRRLQRTHAHQSQRLGLNWNVALETGGWLVSDEISVDIEVELVKQLEQAEQEAEALHHA